MKIANDVMIVVIVIVIVAVSEIETVIADAIVMMIEAGDVIARATEDAEVAPEASLAEATLLTIPSPCRPFEEDAVSEVALPVAALNAVSFVLVQNPT